MVQFIYWDLSHHCSEIQPKTDRLPPGFKLLLLESKSETTGTAPPRAGDHRAFEELTCAESVNFVCMYLCAVEYFFDRYDSSFTLKFE